MIKLFSLNLFLMCITLSAHSIEIIAHRGGSLLVPENSLGGMLHAISNHPFDRIDMDVFMTSDSKIVVVHDHQLSPALHLDEGEFISEESEYFISHMTYDELSKFQVGKINPAHYPHPTHEIAEIELHPIHLLSFIIKEIEEVTNQKMLYQIEMKNTPLHPHLAPNPKIYVHEIATIIKDHGIINRVEVQSFDWKLLLALKKILPDVKISFVTELLEEGTQEFGIYTKEWAGFSAHDFDGDYFDMIDQLGADVWSADIRSLTQDQVNKAHQKGIKVAVWTVNSQNDMEKMIQWKVDAIITDHPIRLAKLLTKKHRQ
ncbi:MAG: glycerophosphodiester phosphodiesterase family protein [Rhabdochlamydiaceae bacterium]|nr:glycerophosphodiester phosphodiesterase family protein [Candidatus Amphrikana amoebophyrae]